MEKAREAKAMDVTTCNKTTPKMQLRVFSGQTGMEDPKRISWWCTASVYAETVVSLSQ